MLLQEAPADTTIYMIAAYIVIFSIMLVYILSLYLRRRNLEKDIQVLQETKEKRA